MVDLRLTVAAKSDQLNADDLIGRTMTVTIKAVKLTGAADQPVAIHFEGDGGKPYKPCLSMRRLMIKVWGDQGGAYVDKRMTLFRDDKVRFGPDAVGGIRISHVSAIEAELTIALNATRGRKVIYTVRPLRAERAADTPPPSEAHDDHRDSSIAAQDDFPGDRPTRGAGEPNKAPATNSGEISLAERIAAFKRRASEATSTTKAKAIWAASERLRIDVDRADPDEFGTSEDLGRHFDECMARLESAEREAGHR